MAERHTTHVNLERVLATFVADLRFEPTAESVWRSIRSPDLARSRRDFLWKLLHGAYRVGGYWENVPSFGHRAVCAVCGVTETMEHILLECDAVRMHCSIVPIEE